MKYYYLSHVFMLLCWFSYGSGQRVGNPDDTAKIERPCPTFDQNCVREFFSKHAHCKKTFGPAPDPYIRPQVANYISRVNLTINLFDLQTRGLNGRIEEFFINRDTDKLVIAVEFRNVSQETEHTYFRFHRRAKEPVVTKGFASAFYQSIVITAVIPEIDDLQLNRAVCTAFSNVALPPTVVSPSAADSNDPQVQLALTEFLANLPVNVQEIFLTDASFFIGTYIQFNICDFGLIIL